MKDTTQAGRGQKEIFKQLMHLKFEIHLFQILTFILVAVLLAVVSSWAWYYFLEHTMQSEIETDVPNSREVAALINPLRYSILPEILSPDMTITLDFAAKKWTLHKVHRFNEKGEIELFDGRYGICGDLAAYTYRKVRPMFDARYAIQYVRVGESEYFFNHATHIALDIRDITKPNAEYILDPSFRRYGKIENLSEYLFLEKMDNLPFVEQCSSDDTFVPGYIAPILIRKNFLVGIMIDEQYGKFDADNYILMIMVTPRSRYVSRYILAFRKINGQRAISEDPNRGIAVLGRDDYNKLRHKAEQIFLSLP